MFINATIWLPRVSGILLGLLNQAYKTYIKQINNMLCRAYELALGLPKSSANRVCWKFSGQNPFKIRMAKLTDFPLNIFNL